MFRAGDEAIIHRPSDITEYPGWIEEMMDIYDGTVAKIMVINRGTNTVKFYGIPFSFSINWIDYQASEELEDIELNMSELM